MQRRQFIKSSLVAGVSCAAIGSRSLSPAALANAADESTAGAKPTSLQFKLTRQAPSKRFDGKSYWCHPRGGIVPGAGRDGQPRVVITMNTGQLEGSDVFKAMYGVTTDDLGATWTEAREVAGLSHRFETIDDQRRPVAVGDFWPAWHRASKTLLGTGQTMTYTPEWSIISPGRRSTTYSVYDPKTDTWAAWKKLQMPEGPKFADSGAGCTQRVDLADGSILLPFYFRPVNDTSRKSISTVAIMRCSWDGEKLTYREHGDELTIDDKTRGLGEPSLAHFDGNFYLTIRQDETSFVTRGKDGLHFEPYREWTFDDGKPLGTYNTQQHWVTHSDGLFLVYTRRGANNDHVFRNRAPLFMAQVDPQRLTVLRATEQILMPERGARLGNFGITQVSPDETWVTDSEWMQPKGCEKYGSDGSLWVARIHWAMPNRAMS